MEEFPSNSQSVPTSDKKEYEPIITGGVTRRKTPVGTKFRETFFSGSDSKGVAQYILLDVIVPSLRDMVAEAGMQTINRILYGESTRGVGRPYRMGASRPAITTRYDKISDGAKRYSAADASTRDISQQARATHDFGEIVLDSRGDAERVLDTLREIVREYHMVSVADLYSHVGISPKHTDHRYGWTDLTGSRISMIRGGGFLIDLPRPVPIGR